MDYDKDGKAEIIGGKKRDDGWEEIDRDEKDFEEMKSAAEIFPVNVIHMKKKESFVMIYKIICMIFISLINFQEKKSLKWEVALE